VQSILLKRSRKISKQAAATFKRSSTSATFVGDVTGINQVITESLILYISDGVHDMPRLTALQTEKSKNWALCL
jgi:hypothetical protein